MRFLQFPIVTTLLLLLLGLINAINTDSTSTFTGLLGSLSNLGYHVKAANIFGALNPSTAADAPGAGTPCARTVRSHRTLESSFSHVHPSIH